MPLVLAAAEVPWWTTLLFSFLLLGLILALAFEEALHAKKSVIAGVFAILSLLMGSALGLIPFEEIVVGSHGLVEHDDVRGKWIDEIDRPHEVDIPPEEEAEESLVHVQGHELDTPPYIPPIDWSVISIILGSSVFVDVTSKSGLFTWIAIRVTKATGGDPLMLLIAYGVMTVLFSAVLNNVTAMIIVGSLTVVSLERLGARDKLLSFLLIEGLLTNIGGLLTLISSVPNIIVGATAGIKFFTFFLISAPFVALATAATIALGAWFNKIHRLETEQEQTEAAERVDGFDENDGVESWPFFYFSTAMLLLFIVMVALVSTFPKQMPFGLGGLGIGYVALTFAGIMLLRYAAQASDFYKAVDWDLIGFFMALFVVIAVMEYAQVLEAIGKGLGYVLALGAYLGTAALLVASAFFSSVTDNIPLAAMLAKILGADPEVGSNPGSPYWWAVIFGANLGGNLTPIGSASTLLAVTLMHKHKLPMSFLDFVKRAFPYAVMQIALAIVYVLAITSLGVLA